MKKWLIYEFFKKNLVLDYQIGILIDKKNLYIPIPIYIKY